MSKQVTANSDITKYVQFNDSIQLIEKVPLLILQSPTSPPPATRRRKSLNIVRVGPEADKDERKLIFLVLRTIVI